MTHDDAVVLSDADIQLALEFSPLPPVPADPTNAYADDPNAAVLGQALFFDTRLSGNGAVSCVTCHDPDKGWADGRTLAKGVANHPMHTPSVLNTAYNRWFFWDGRKDTLWSQALGPLEDHREHDTDRLAIAHVLSEDEAYRTAYEAVFGRLPALNDGARFPPHARPDPERPQSEHAQAWAAMRDEDRDAANRVFVNVGKALAAYQRRLVSASSPFDRFVEGLRGEEGGDISAMSPSEQRGFALFGGKALCIVCHDGPTFSDGEFHTNLVPTAEGVDPGRPVGIVRLLDDPFNSASIFADDDGVLARTKLAFPRIGWESPGAFKTPSLRNVSRTAPYMHEGQIATLEEVIAFYDTLEGAAAEGPHTERILRPIGLEESERADLLAFLHALTNDTVPEGLRRPPEPPYVR
jgi:cytochrome c peroxidase